MGRRAKHIRLVERSTPIEAPILTSEAAQREFVNLTQRLVDVAIEMIDLVDGDPDLEASEPIEEDDPSEDREAA